MNSPRALLLLSCGLLLGAGCVDDPKKEARPPAPRPTVKPRPRPVEPAAGKITVYPRHTGNPRMDRFIKEYKEAVTGGGKEKELWDKLAAQMSATHKYPIKSWTGVKFTTLNTQDVTVDIFVPQTKGKKPPLLVWFPGGGFVMYLLGFPSGGLIAGQYGYAAAFVFYNLSTSSSGKFPAGRRSWPHALIGAKRALRYLKDNATKYGYDASKVVVGGFSAGGALASYLGATSGQNLLEEGPKADPKTTVHGVWISSPVSNLDYFNPKNPNLSASRKTKWSKLWWAITFYLGQWVDSPQAQWAVKQADPMGHVTSAASKVYWIIGHGDADKVVPYEQSTMMRDTLLKAGASVRLYRHKGEGHHLSTVRLDRMVHMMKLVHGP